MRDDSAFVCRSLRGRCLGVLPGLWLCVLGLAGCVDYGYPPAANAQQSSTGYKYFTRIRDSSGKYRDGGPLGPGDTYFYTYDISPSALDAISSDRELAAHQFIESRNAVPPECISGFRVVHLGSLENGAVVVSIECNASDVKK